LGAKEGAILRRSQRGSWYATKDARVMSSLSHLFDILLHFNIYLRPFAESYGSWIYAILFAMIFCETGLVVTPFVPGDSLLFAVGALTAGANSPGGTASLDLWLILISLTLAGVLGNTVNYSIGYALGQRLFNNPNSRIFNRKHLDRTHAFYEKHGAKAVILSRFFPIIRTFAPFVAGMGQMGYRKFFAYNVIGASAWVFSFVLLGHYFGNLPYVQKNFSLVILGILVVSLIPAGLEFVRALRARRNV
jgi:membrane-associated protein